MILPAVVGLSLGGCLSGTAAPAADYLVYAYRSEEGLPQNSVTCLAQTPDGYLWVGTRSGGLARYDGLRFVEFNPQNTPELQDVEIEELTVDATGTMWIATGNESITSLKEGKFRLVRTRHAPPRWHPAVPIGEDSSSVIFAGRRSQARRVFREGPPDQAERIQLRPPPRVPIFEFARSAQGETWYVSTDGRLCRIRLDGREMPESEAIQLDQPVRQLVSTPTGVLWAATDSRLGRIIDGTFVEVAPENGPPPSRIHRIVPAGKRGLWVWEAEGLRRLESGRWVAHAEDFPLPAVAPNMRLFASQEGGLWAVRYGQHLFVVSPDGTTRTLGKDQGLPSTLISCWLEDEEGNIWMGTRDSGLVRIRSRLFKSYGEGDGIPGRVVQSVCEARDGTLWVGTSPGGLAFLREGRFHAIALPRPDSGTVQSVTVFPHALDGIWTGAENGGVLRFLQGEFTRPLRQTPGFVDVILEDSKSRVWVGNGGGLLMWQDGERTAFGRQQGFVEGVGVRALAEGLAGIIWIGTGPGDLWRYDGEGLVRYSPPEMWPPARIATLLYDSEGVVWIGTLGGGLLRFQDERFSRITSRDGLPDDTVVQLLEDGQGNLWGGTYAGVFRVAKADLSAVAAGREAHLSCLAYGAPDGLPAQECSGWYQPSCWRASDGRLWFATVRGLAVVDPAAVEVNHRPPPVIIEQFLVDGSPRDFRAEGESHNQSSPSAGPLQIEPGRHYVEFLFTGLDFSAPDKVRFRWRLEGAEPKWREGGSQRRVGYGPLLPGDYSFQVVAANSYGVWNEQGTGLSFTVLPYFWETWWFKIGMITLTLILVSLSLTTILARRHRLELDRLERQRAVEQERSRIARDLHDGLGASLTRVSMLSALVSRECEPHPRIEELTQNIRSAAREMVSALNEIVWAINPKNDTLTELLGYLGNFAAGFFRTTPIRCRLKFPSDLPDTPLSSNVRHDLLLAFKEAINNAARHSGASEVWIRARLEDGLLLLSVEDNGRGLRPEAERQSLGNGLRNMHERLERAGGQLVLRERPGGGCIVELRLPLTQA